MAKNEASTWNRGRYWAATIALCAILIYSALSTLRDPTSSERLGNEIGVPSFIVIYALPISKLLCAAIILWRGLPRLRLFAYAFVLFYLVLDLTGMLRVHEYLNAATAVFKLVVWALAFWWDRDRIHQQKLASA